MNQREALVKYLRRNKTGITVWTAMQDLGIARLSERVRELEADGYEFHRHTLIKAGDTLFNPHDRDQYHTVLQDGEGQLFLGDLDSPLERYAPHIWWEVVHNAKNQGLPKAVPLD